MNDGQCGNGRYCEGGMCHPKRRTGESCENSRQCLLGLCAVLLGSRICVAP
jgi:hypothetical protein